MFTENITILINELKEISLDISSKKIELINTISNQELNQNYISSLDQEQDNRVARLFHSRNIPNYLSAVDFFYKNNFVFFYGDDPTSIGYINQMFLYEIQEKERAHINLFGKCKDFEWITCGVKHFHGIFDITHEEKSGSQTLDDNTVFFYDDAEEMYANVVKLIKEVESRKMHPEHLDLLILKQWQDKTKFTLERVCSDYKNYLKIHEGAHLLLDNIFEFRSNNFKTDLELMIYNKETEKLAILSQMAFSDLPAYNLYEFLNLNQSNECYYETMEDIARDFMIIITNYKEDFPNLKHLFNDSREYFSTEEIFKLCGALEISQISDMSKVILDTEFKPLFYSKNPKDLGFDLNNNKLIVTSN